MFGPGYDDHEDTIKEKILYISVVIAYLAIGATLTYAAMHYFGDFAAAMVATLYTGIPLLLVGYFILR